MASCLIIHRLLAILTRTAPPSKVQFASEEILDCLLAKVNVWKVVFALLPAKDRIALEMTNKRLRSLMLACWKRVTSFDAESVAEMSADPSKRWAAVVAICVDRIGDGLRSVTLRDELLTAVADWSAALQSIGEGCPNVETVNFVFTLKVICFYPIPPNIRFESFPRLNTLSCSSAERDEAFAAVSAAVWLSIPASIEVIRGLTGTKKKPFDNAAQLEGFFADRRALRELRIGRLHARTDSKADVFRVVAERCPQLKVIELLYSTCIDYRGVVALELMKELRIRAADLNETEIVTICERSPLVEVLEFGSRFSDNFKQQSAALDALGALTKLVELHIRWHIYSEEVASSLVTKFVRELARNSGASLRRLELYGDMPLPTAAIEALADGCGKLRRVEFSVRIGEATPASIRHLIDCIVDDPSWILSSGEPALRIHISIHGIHYDIDEGENNAGRAAFEAFSASAAANLPAGVRLRIW